MAKTDDGGPAFPRPDILDEEMCIMEPAHDGMPLRDWFAGQAMALHWHTVMEDNACDELGLTREQMLEAASTLAYWHADAMLAEKRRRDGDGS